MAIINIDVWSRLSAAFGPGMSRVIGAANMIATGVQVVNSYDEWAKVPEYYDFVEPGAFDLILKNGAQSYELSFTAENKLFDGIYFPPPVPQFAREKAISVTNVDNSAMQVIENFGIKPYSITLSGIAVDMSGGMKVADMMATVSKLFDIQDLIDVEGGMYNDLGIYSIYFSRIESMNVLDGYPDTIVYKLTAYSCEPASSMLSS